MKKKDIIIAILAVIAVAVICVVKVSAGEQAHLISRLPAGMDVEFGKPDEEFFTAQLSEAQSSEYSEPIDEGGDVQMTELGEWTYTFYCNCERCCGEWAGGNTASGMPPTSRHTIATDGLPFGTVLYLSGGGVDGFYTVEDRGVPYGWVDIYVDSHEQALQGGMGTTKVFIVN